MISKFPPLRGIVPALILLTLPILPIQAGVEFGNTTQVFAHVAFGAGSSSSISIHNPGNETISIRSRFINSLGFVIPPIRDLEVGAKGTGSLVFEGPEALNVGWLELTSNDPFIATEFLRIAVGGQEAPQIGVLPSTLTTQAKFFGFVTPEKRTGIAVANPSFFNAISFTIRLLSASGQVVATRQFTIDPFEHMAGFLNEPAFFPGLTSFEGTVELLNATEPIPFLNLTQDSENNLATVAVFLPLPE